MAREAAAAGRLRLRARRPERASAGDPSQPANVRRLDPSTRLLYGHGRALGDSLPGRRLDCHRSTQAREQGARRARLREMYVHLKAFIQARRRTARARGLYEIGQALSGGQTSTAYARAARLYGRALRLLEPDSAATNRGASRQDLRDELRARLRRRSLLAPVLERRRQIAVAIAALALVIAACIALVPSLRQRVFPHNLAEGKRWVVSTALPGYPASGIMGAEPAPDFMFHTLDQAFPSVTLDLGVPMRVRAVTIVNRASCCRERAVPMSILLSKTGAQFTQVAYRRDTFNDWTARFAPARARFVRVRIERISALHLRQIAVY